ncbi:hypothetical protein C2S52_016124 [Perilla frutescens var. hirtella]|nr:hypothetical protein C2S52_016124 [Perilla frutescens var. hirtella]KAH6815116.1 hypothetical protein C2S51_019936 [Perilla frutescens var. frutescens]
MFSDSGVKLKPSGMRATIAHRRMPRSFEHEDHYITAVAKMTEFKTRLVDLTLVLYSLDYNLPSSAVSYIGEEDCMLKLHVGVDKVRFNVKYQYRVIYHSKRNQYSCLIRLGDGWKDVVEFMELDQGDFIEFRSCFCDRRRFYVAKKLHDALIEVKAEEFDGELIEVSD